MNSATERSTQTGALIINADDWGRTVETTDRILDCVSFGTVSSASAMVFMEDSERAAAMARERAVDVGLHLNFTTAFSAAGCSSRLLQHQQRLCAYLLRNRIAQVFYHPGLASSFRYVVATQIDEFRRLYGTSPSRIDGHHHMHLCANVVFGKLMPEGVLVRRNFSFSASEKSWMNRFYRELVDRRLQQRHVLVDYLFSLVPVEPIDRLQRIFALAYHAIVEVETHPINPEEFRFLTSREVFRQLGDLRIATGFGMSVRMKSPGGCSSD